MHRSTRTAPSDGLHVSQLATLLCVAAIVAAGCTRGPDWAGTIEERDGAVYVANPAEGLWADAESPPLRFELEQVYGADMEPQEAILGRGYQLSFDADAQSNLYVLDGQASRLVAFAADGSVRWTAGRAGEGPGEFDNARGLALTGDKVLAVVNRGSNRLDLWDTSGEYTRSLPLNEPDLDFEGARFLRVAGSPGPGELVVYSGMWGGFGARVFVLGLGEPEILESFQWNQLPEVQMPPGLACDLGVRVAGDRIMVGSAAGYRFRIYGPEGILQREVTRAVDYPIRCGFAEDGGSRTIIGFGSLSPPMPLASGHLLVAVSWIEGVDDPDAEAAAGMERMRAQEPPPPRESAFSFDLFDPEGRFLYSLLSETGYPSIGTVHFIGRDGRLYTLSEDPFPQIRRYRVEIDER